MCPPRELVCQDNHWQSQWQQKALASDKKDALFKVDEGFAGQHPFNKEVFFPEKDIRSLGHARWRCQYHVVFAPKDRRMVIYGKIKREIGCILRKLCEQKDVEIIEVQACPKPKKKQKQPVYGREEKTNSPFRGRWYKALLEPTQAPG